MIAYEDIKYFIVIHCGADRRTLKKYFRLLEEFHFLTPISKSSVKDRSKATIRNPMSGNMIPKEYSSDRIGFTAYVFGPQAPKGFPRSPLQRFFSGESPSEKICVRVSNADRSSTVRFEASEDVVRPSAGVGREVEKEKKERLLSHTHIHNKVIEKNAITREEQRTISLYEELADKRKSRSE